MSPVWKLQAGFSRATLSRLTWVRGEKRCPPASWPEKAQSDGTGAAGEVWAKAVAWMAITAAIARRALRRLQGFNIMRLTSISPGVRG